MQNQGIGQNIWLWVNSHRCWLKQRESKLVLNEILKSLMQDAREKARKTPAGENWRSLNPQNFAENRRSNSRLRKSAHFGKNQSMLYPIVTVSVCRIFEDHLVRRSLLMLSALISPISGAQGISIVKELLRSRQRRG
ncbi:hypothetical protein PoB_005729400 [Plakobranchus ocellatus]|uniref:Uncharacterized protein n=1 Tax=Plakobranchus ocellatus TaxID=259542 RepID=A0AAV4CHV6_9GAST|nr:hypothetical protein PoB_005729400 [Plakobranchus ocellatus]